MKIATFFFCFLFGLTYSQNKTQNFIQKNIEFVGPINYNIRLIIDDSIQYRITDVVNKIDTVFSGDRPGDFIIMNNIKSLVVNGHKLDNENVPLSIEIPTKIGKIIKK
jgi:hypothetical protein